MSVYHFGAVGDGKADDTQALQHALDAGDGVLDLEKGTYRITQPLKFYQTVGSEGIAEGQLNNIISANLREIFGKEDFAELLKPKRAELMLEIRRLVDNGSSHLGLEVVDVRIKRVDLPEENKAAIFLSMQTQREQEARGIRASGGKVARELRAGADKEQRIIVAQAKKTKLYNDAFGNDRDFFDFYRSLQAMRKGLTGQSTSYVGPAQGEFFRFFKGESVGLGK